MKSRYPDVLLLFVVFPLVDALVRDGFVSPAEDGLLGDLSLELHKCSSDLITLVLLLE